MIERPIPSSGETLPVIGLGTWQTFDVGTDRQHLERVVETFVEGGARLIDSSPMYGKAESVVGDIVAKQGVRDRIFVATKVWTSGREHGMEQMQDSMRKLRVDVCDLMQVHNLVDVFTHLRTLRVWKSEGLVRYIGITHYHAGAFGEVERVLAREPVDFLQINYSAGEPEAADRLLPLAADRGVAVIVNRPFATGDLLRRLRTRPLPPWAASLGLRTWAQLLLSFVISHPAVTCAIPATSDAGHLRDNLAAGAVLMPEEYRRSMIAAVR